MSAGDKLGGAVKGVFNTIHGAGEAIRGNINDGLDSAGEGLRQASSDKDGHSTTTSSSDPSTFGKSDDYNQSGNHQGVAQKGTDEFKQGIEQISNAFNSNKSSNTHSSV
ncbi:hypothetical protein EX895_003697 [Sporisorium graminicola]|uniref:Uncharacterized protein n=1 Tax=Sporisorium graminicola TaxID=280036 RepID=A0A4U7KRF9_9BASI|nr:hypothetical protein EX895_003697 [Sporisorium graminicola]TKY87020.1 hypothetical protein EX895_003697 [Sporisorium graminicola]